VVFFESAFAVGRQKPVLEDDTLSCYAGELAQHVMVPLKNSVVGWVDQCCVPRLIFEGQVSGVGFYVCAWFVQVEAAIADGAFSVASV
jgi:hypothetical protein